MARLKPCPDAARLFEARCDSTSIAFRLRIAPVRSQIFPIRAFFVAAKRRVGETVILGREPGMLKHDPNSAEQATDAEIRRGVGSGFALASA